MNENTDLRQVSLRLDSTKAINSDPGMSELQIKELARRGKKHVKQSENGLPDIKNASKPTKT